MIDIIIIGYSGHSYVILDSIYSSGGTVKGYCDREEKKDNPFDLNYLGNENLDLISGSNWFVCIGDNTIREKVHLQFSHDTPPTSVIHSSAVVGSHCTIGAGVFISANATVNALAKIGDGVIVNTGVVVEHECQVGDFVHIAPGAVLTGNVSVGKNTFIGANSIIKQGVQIGKNVIIGAGAVVLSDVTDNSVVVGNPGKPLSPK